MANFLTGPTTEGLRRADHAGVPEAVLRQHAPAAWPPGSRRRWRRRVAVEPAEPGRRPSWWRKPKGGVFDGQTLKVTTINIDGKWTIDKITTSEHARSGP